MNTTKFRSSHRTGQSGQVMLFVVLALSIFLLGAIALAVDLSYLWFHRQAAQTAADAACTAGAMDLLVDATNGTTTQGHFTAGSAFDCHDTSPNSNTPGNTNPAPCVYAALNGYTASVVNGNNDLGNSVYVDFPSSVPGVTAPPTSVAPTAFMRVAITDNAPTFFAGMLSGLTKQSVRAVALCGVTEAAAPIPILVLDPQNPPKGNALSVQGTPIISIYGGPARSIEVNSSDPAAVGVGGNALIDLSNGGPNNSGSDLGTFGGPTTPPLIPKNWNPGTTGSWIAPAAPIADPFSQVCYPGQTSNCTAAINGYSAPTPPGTPTVPSDLNSSNSQNQQKKPCTASDIQGGTCYVTYKTHGCPDTTSTISNLTCVLYTQGAYPGGIAVKNMTAVFDPGLYYVTGGLALQSNATVRPGTALGDGSGGVTFYFTDSNSVSVWANSGKNTALDSFNTLKGPVDSSGTPYPGMQAYSRGVQCTSGSAVPANLQGGGAGINIGGNILLGPCTGYYGDPLGANEPASIGEQRWFLFFQSRSAQNVSANWGGGGQFLLAGSMYFHSCSSTGAGTGCGSAGSYFTDNFTMAGNSGSGTYVLGEIVTDNLTLQGTSGITMDLNPTRAFNILKASLYQ